MSIDRIGKPSVPPLETPGIGPSGRTSGENFQVTRASTGEVSTSPLDQVGRGEISLDEYLNVQVEDATSHLQGKLAPAELEFVKQTLREQLENDPVLVELLRRTGAATGPQE